MSESSPRKADLARRVWRLMFDFLIRTSPERTESLGRRGLTPNDSRGLSSLDRDSGRTMRSLAQEWKCDPSNATAIVDRLERFGLAERRTIARDRRVRLVVLTPAGVQARRELMEEFYAPPPELLELDRASLAALQRALEKLPGLGSIPS
jgi:DNA-binding MarR family transcriptional regulator